MPDGTFWDRRYLEGNMGWDMGDVSPPLREYFGQFTRKDLSILIPGCGNAYEAEWLLRHGFTNVTLLDISTVLMERLRARFSPDASGASASGASTYGVSVSGAPLRLINGDFFEHTGQYDLLIEQTFFCALDPVLRPAYVEQAAKLLAPGGKLAGLLFDRNFVGGPPFGGDRVEYRRLFEQKFKVRTMETCTNSIRPRAGSEVFFIAEKRMDL